MASPTARRARAAISRTFLVAAAAAWATKLAGVTNHQERLARRSGQGGAGVAGVLDFIVGWAFLTDAEAFARWRNDLDRGGLRKVWAMAALELAAICAGFLATLPSAPRALVLMAACLLVCLSLTDPPETAVEIVANHARLGVPLPSYRIAVVAGCVLGAVSQVLAALALAWDDDDGRGGGMDGGGGAEEEEDEAAAAAAADELAPSSTSSDPEKGGGAFLSPAATASSAPAPPPSPFPHPTAPPYPPDPTARGLAPWQARLEALTLRTLDTNRDAVVRGGYALCAVAWAVTVAGIVQGATARRGPHAWWPTHIPLAALVAGAQGFALLLAALNAYGPIPWIRGRAGLASLVALEGAAIATVTRINRRWASTATLFGFRVVGSTPSAPPGWFVFNGGAWGFVAVAASVAVAAGSTRRRPVADAHPPRALFQRLSAAAGVAVATAGFFTCVVTSVKTFFATGGGRVLPESALYSLDGDVSWLLYLLPLPAFMVLTPCVQATDLTHGRMATGCALVSTGCLVLYAYLLTPPLALGNKVGLGLIVSGFLVVCVLGYVDTDGPTARAVMRGVRRAQAAVHLARVRRARRQVSLFMPAGFRVNAGTGTDADDDDDERGITVLLVGQKDEGGSGGGGGGRGLPPATTAAAPDLNLEKVLGYGSFGAVYRGTFRGARVAVKCVFAPSARAAAAARREAALGLSLRHPSVLATYAVVDAPMEAVAWPADLALPPGALAAAGPAADRRARRSGGPRPRLVSIVMEICDGGSLDRAVRLGRMAAPPAAAKARSRPPSRPATPPLELLSSSLLRAAVGSGSGGSGDGGGGGGGSSGPATPRPPAGSPDRPRTPALPTTTPSPARRVSSLFKLDGAGAATGPQPAPRPNAAAVLATLLDVASGLAFLHSVGVVHGDVKPANILLRSSVAPDPAGRTFRAILADFGLSKSMLRPPGDGGAAAGALPGGVVGPDADRLTHYTASGHGTMVYAAPELLSLGRTSPAADVFALGIVMAEVWSGAPPYGQLPPAAVFFSVVAEGRRPSLEGLHDAPPGYTALMQACWAAQPHARPPASVVVKWLKEMLATAVAATAGPSRSPSPRLDGSGTTLVKTPSLGDLILGAGRGRGSSGWYSSESGRSSGGGRGSR